MAPFWHGFEKQALDDDDGKVKRGLKITAAAAGGALAGGWAAPRAAYKAFPGKDVRDAKAKSLKAHKHMHAVDFDHGGRAVKEYGKARAEHVNAALKRWHKLKGPAMGAGALAGALGAGALAHRLSNKKKDT